MYSYVNFPLYVRNIWPCFLADDHVFMMTQRKALMILQMCVPDMRFYQTDYM